MWDKSNSKESDTEEMRRKGVLERGRGGILERGSRDEERTKVSLVGSV